MADRLTYPGTVAAGDLITAANQARLPGGWLAYEALTTNVSTSGGGELEVHSVEATVSGTNDRLIRMSWYFGDGIFSANTDIFAAFVRRGVAPIGQGTLRGQRDVGSGIALSGPIIISGIIITEPGTYTWKAGIIRLAGSGTFTVQRNVIGTSPGPGWLLVEDLGPYPTG
jgi:hypothetical protein